MQARLHPGPAHFSWGWGDHSDGHDGSFGRTGHWPRSGKAHSPRASTLFGTQHIVTGQWVRLAKPIRGRRRPFLRPILPSLPMGSSENRGRHDCNHASSAPPRPRPFSWGGVTIPMVMTVRLVVRHWLRSGIASDGVVRSEDVEPRMEDGENEMVESKRNQPKMTQINADELKKFVKLSGIPSSSSASICG